MHSQGADPCASAPTLFSLRPLERKRSKRGGFQNQPFVLNQPWVIFCRTNAWNVTPDSTPIPDIFRARIARLSWLAPRA